MPRKMPRLRVRAPKSPRPLNLTRVDPDNRLALEHRVRNHIYSHSKPDSHLDLKTVIHPRWKWTIHSMTKKPDLKPHTVTDLLDKTVSTKHGRIIYIFRNSKTNQVIYSLAPLLDNYHLDQLPFIGRHSKPPALRSDEWLPHCVATFSSSEQGLHAFRKLREFRKLHEVSWEKTNPEWKRLNAQVRMKKIMDQVANTSADLAAVLTAQEAQAITMTKKSETSDAQVAAYLKKRWPEIHALAETSLAEKKREGDDLAWLEKQIKSLDRQLRMSHLQDEKNQTRLKIARRSHEVRINNIQYAQRKSAQYKKAAQEPGFNTEEFEVSLLARSVLPRPMRRTLPQPFTMDVELKWADLLDAEYAAGSWPASVTHEILPVKAARESAQMMSTEEFQNAIENEVFGVISSLEEEAREQIRRTEEAEAEANKSVLKKVMDLRPWKRSEAVA